MSAINRDSDIKREARRG